MPRTALHTLALGRLLFPELWQVVLELEALELAVSPAMHLWLYGIWAVQAGDGNLQVGATCTADLKHQEESAQSLMILAREVLLTLSLPDNLLMSHAVLTQMRAHGKEERGTWQDRHAARACQYIKMTARR